MKTLIAVLSIFVLAAGAAHAQYQRPEPILSVIYAPAQQYKNALGIEYLRPIKNKSTVGAALIISGNPTGDSETEESIPYSHYRVDENDGTVSLLYLMGKGTKGSLFIIGIGIGVEITSYTQVSTLTGTKWNGGSSEKYQPEAQVSYRFKAGKSVYGQLGCDTMYGGFGGLWMKL